MRIPLQKQLGQGKRALARLLGRQPAPKSTAPKQDPYRRRIAAGERPGPAALTQARQWLARGATADALRLGYELLGDPGSVEVGRSVLGLCQLAASTPAQAWAEFVTVENPELRALACPEYAIAGFGADPQACADRCEQIVVDQASTLTPYTVLVMARHGFSVAHEAFARHAADAAEAGAFGELTEVTEREFTRLRSWFSDGFRRQPPQLVDADFRFGVIDYKQPDNASRNVGDYIQTLASLGHLVRQQGLRFVGDPALVAEVDDLRRTVKPERVRSDATATVQLLELQRDGNVYQDLPEPTWAVMFGWYLHPTYSGGYNLPFHPNLRPLFISFHLNKPDALTDDAIAYLRRWGPVGCRDWQTVALLASAGVPAFFSGCITTTVDTVFARTGPDERTGVAYIDAKDAPDEDEQIEQSVGDIRARGLAENLALGREWVQRYHTEFAEVNTTRLHSYLPSRSVGCRVDFHPNNPSDVRFGGLIGIDDDAFEAIRQGILTKLDAMLQQLAGGADEQQVYDRWRELCAADVAAADEFLAGLRFDDGVLPAVDLGPLGERVLVIPAARASKSLLRLLDSVADRAPDVPVLVIGPLNHEDLPKRVRLIVSGDNRDLTLAAVLAAMPDATRVVLLNADSVLRGDISGLFETPTSAAGVAANPEVRRNRQSLSALIRRVSSRQGDDWRQALRFAAAAHRRCPHGAHVADARTCVIDVRALRAAGWAQLAPELIGTFGARFGEALAVVTRGDVAALPAHALTRLGVEPTDPQALLLQGAGAARVPLKWLEASSKARAVVGVAKVAIVVVSYNALSYARTMLATVRTTRGVDYEIVVVDNNSNRQTKLFWTAMRFLGRINRLALLDRNTFFAEGCNIGVAMSPRDATHILLLNTDCEIKDPDWLARMIAAHERGATGMRYVTTGPWPRTDGFCLLVDRGVWGEGLDESFQWWWSVTGFEARLLREGLTVTAIRNYEKVVVHHWGKSGTAFKKARSGDAKAETIRSWFEGRQVRVLDELPPVDGTGAAPST